MPLKTRGARRASAGPPRIDSRDEPRWSLACSLSSSARSRVRVDYREDQRLIALERGQARFDVAKDPTRPFRVRARDQTVIALGTQFNVEIVAGSVLVTMIEGHVAVTGVAQLPAADAGSAPAQRAAKPREDSRVRQPAALQPERPAIELEAGEGLRVRQDGEATLIANVNVERATAWQAGKMFFDNEPLASAVERVNRYSHEQIEVDPSVAHVRVSGVFNAGDSRAFIEAVTEYFPVQVHRASGSRIRLDER
jgi:transmembrane sensor